MIGPNEIMLIDNEIIHDIILAIDSSIESNHGKYSFECGIYYGILSIDMINKISNLYSSVGWKYIYYKVHRRPKYSLFADNDNVCFRFSMNELEEADGFIHINNTNITDNEIDEIEYKIKNLKIQ